MNRREFLQLLHLAAAAGVLSGCARGGLRASADPYTLPLHGNARLLHVTDIHAQLLPVHYREPNVNLGIGATRGRPPHLVGEAFLEHFGIAAGGRDAHAFTYLDFLAGAERFGRLGGFAHLKTLVEQLRAAAGPGNSLLLDGGDLWQGSGTAVWTRGRDMVEASNALGINIMTGHWEFTYEADEVRANIAAFAGEFLAQNVFLTDDAVFSGAAAWDEASGRAFKPSTIRELGGRRVAIIGQAFPYTPIANPAYLIPDWSFGIREAELQAEVDRLREYEKVDAIVLLSHNGMDVDLKLAGRVTGIDVILGGHTHDAVPRPVEVENRSGRTVVTNAGTNGKFVAVLDLDIGAGRLNGYRYHLLPVFSDLIRPDPAMAATIERLRAPYTDQLGETLAVADELLYRRGNFNGPMDQLICDAMRNVLGADIAFSPGFRWGTTILPGQAITMEDVLAETAITYPETYVREMSGADIKTIMEDVCDNLFNPDPYYQQGGDMVRVGGMDYACDPTADIQHRISEMRLDNGKALDPDRKYKVAGWATVNARESGPPIWDVVAEYLRDLGSVRLGRVNQPRLVNVGANPGLAGYP